MTTMKWETSTKDNPCLFPLLEQSLHLQVLPRMTQRIQSQIRKEADQKILGSLAGVETKKNRNGQNQ